MDPIRLVIADDHALFREGLRTILNTYEDLEVVAEAAHGRELQALMGQHEVDVVLLDLKMPEMDGLQATAWLREKHPEVRVIILSMVDEDRMVAHLMEQGVHGYLLKDTQSDELHRALRSVVDRGYYFNERTSKALLESVKHKSKKPPSLDYGQTLTRREQEVLDLICKELTTAEIGEKLFISPRTVEGHRKSLVEKFGVRNTAGLVLKAYKEGWIE